MIRVVAAALPSTKTYRSRELRAVLGGVWPDGRDATVILDMRKAASRFDRGGKRHQSSTSVYSVAEVREVGFNGRTFVWDKLHPAVDDEEERTPDMPPPPYTTRIDRYGVGWCGCQAGVCRRGETSCRHVDALKYLLDAGEFDGEIDGC